jgi:hypothetical protein
MSQPIPIASFDHLPPAQTLVRELTARGFEAGLLNESAEQTVHFFTAVPRAQFRVTVPPEVMTSALEAFASLTPLPEERAAECPLREVIRCPDCGSTRVEYPQFSRNTIVGALPAVAAAVGMVEPQFFCQACHYTWAPAPTDAPPVRDAIA